MRQIFLNWAWLDLLNNNGTGKADTGSYNCSRYSLFGKAWEKLPTDAVNWCWFQLVCQNISPLWVPILLSLRSYRALAIASAVIELIFSILENSLLCVEDKITQSELVQQVATAAKAGIAGGVITGILLTLCMIFPLIAALWRCCCDALGACRYWFYGNSRLGNLLSRRSTIWYYWTDTKISGADWSDNLSKALTLIRYPAYSKSRVSRYCKWLGNINSMDSLEKTQDRQHPQHKRDRASVNSLLPSEATDYNLSKLARLIIRYRGFPGARDIQSNLKKVLLKWNPTEKVFMNKPVKFTPNVKFTGNKKAMEKIGFKILIISTFIGTKFAVKKIVGTVLF